MIYWLDCFSHLNYSAYTKPIDQHNLICYATSSINKTRSWKLYPYCLISTFTNQSDQIQRLFLPICVGSCFHPDWFTRLTDGLRRSLPWVVHTQTHTDKAVKFRHKVENLPPFGMQVFYHYSSGKKNKSNARDLFASIAKLQV